MFSRPSYWFLNLVVRRHGLEGRKWWEGSSQLGFLQPWGQAKEKDSGVKAAYAFSSLRSVVSLIPSAPFSCTSGFFSLFVSP